MAHDRHTWRGQPLSFWGEALNHPDGEMRWRAVDEIRHIATPPKSIPLLLSAMTDEYWRARALAVHALYDIAFDLEFHPLLDQTVMPLARALGDENREVSLNAAYTLELLGPRASAALPALNLAAERGDDELRSAANDAISRVTGRIGLHESLRPSPTEQSGHPDP